MRVTGFCLGMHLSVALLSAQSSSTITGLVADATALPVPGVKVVVTAVETGVQHRTTTNEEGYYTVPSLPPLTYQVRAEAEGFRPARSQPAKVNAGVSMRVDLILRPDSAREVVDVVAQASAIETDASMVIFTVSQQEIDRLPIEGRNALEVATTLPGITGELGSDEGGIFQDVPTAGAGLSIGGGRASTSAILADGANATSVGIGRATVTYSPDTVQEVQVITSTFSARYGVSGGGIIQKVSRTGGNRFRGTLYWYHRNPLFHARQFNRPIAPQQRRNEAGFILSGPVNIPKLYRGRNRTFFFTSIEPRRYFDAIDIYERFPTLEERQGDFRNSYLAPGQRPFLLYQQIRCVPSPADCQQVLPMHRPSGTAHYPLFSADDPDPSKRGLVIPRAYLDPLVQKILEDVPIPNQPYDPQGMNYFGTRGVYGSSNRWNVKLDHNISDRLRLSGRYTEIPNYSDRYRVHRENLFFSYQSDLSLTRQAQLSKTYTISPREVNELRLAYTFADYSRIPPGDLASVNYTTGKFGLPNALSYGYPEFASGFGSYGLSAGSLGNYIEHQYQVSNDLSMTRGRHTISVGGDARLQFLNVKSLGLRDMCCSRYTWATAQTNSGNNNTTGGAGGLQFASFLLGVPNGINIRSLIIPYYYRWRVAAAYFQDDFKVRPNFTLNIGIRWQYNSPRAEKFNRQATIDLDHPVEILDDEGDLRAITFNYLYSGFGRSRYLEPVFKKNFEPRFGFAWSPGWAPLRKRSLVVRGGYGISHVPSTGRGRDPVPDFGSGSTAGYNFARWNNNNPPRANMAQNPNYLVSLSRNKPILNPDPLVLLLPENGVLCHSCGPVRDSRVPGGALISFAPRARSPYVQTWNLTTQMQLPARFVMSLSYLGQKGNRLHSPLLPVNNPDPIQYEALLNAGGDPNETIEDPFGRTDSAGNLLTTTLVNLMRPIPTAGEISVAGLTDSMSVFHAGAYSIERRFTEGLGLRFNYTWGKAIDTASDGNISGGAASFLWGTTRMQNSADLKSNRSVSLFDTRHRLNITTSIDLPFGRQKRFFANAGKWAQAAVGNWSISALGSIYSGRPFALFLGDANGVPGGASGAERIRPDMVYGVPLINPRWSKNVANDVPYFNPEAFARPEFGRLGNAPRTLDWARNPWIHTLNASILRDFYPWEGRRRYFQFRAEFFNVLNHATFTTVAGSNVSQLFTGSPPVSRTGLSLAGPIPYFPDKTTSFYPAGSREDILGRFYSQNFGKLWRDRNGPGRVVQLALKVYF